MTALAANFAAVGTHLAAAPTPQERMAASLKRTRIPSRRIEVYGSQIVVTCTSVGTAQRWHSLLTRIAGRVRSLESVEDAPSSKSGRRRPVVRVWRVYATV